MKILLAFFFLFFGVLSYKVSHAQPMLILCNTGVPCNSTGPSNTKNGTPAWQAGYFINTNFTDLWATLYAPLTGDISCPSGTNNCTINSSAVTLGKQANLSAYSVQGNSTSSATAPQAMNATQVSIFTGYPMSVVAVSTSNIATLSGLLTVDGYTTHPGEDVYLNAQTTSSQNGVYTVASGAWTRSQKMPSGFVLPQYCNVTIYVANTYTLAAHSGVSYRILTAGGAITIGTTGFTANPVNINSATSTAAGVVELSDSGSGIIVPVLNPSPTGAGGHQYDCATFSTATGSIGDVANLANLLGGCALVGPNGHLYVTANGTAPTVTGTGCSLAANSTDQHGNIIATGVDNCTLHYGSTFDLLPFCTIVGHSATVLPYISTAATTAQVIFTTAAAGNFDYLCF